MSRFLLGRGLIGRNRRQLAIAVSVLVSSGACSAGDAGRGGSQTSTSGSGGATSAMTTSSQGGSAASRGAGGNAANTATGASGQGAGAAGTVAPMDAGVNKDAGPVGDARAPAQDSGPAAPPVALRMTELYLRDPHFFLNSTSMNPTDITDMAFLGQSVNGNLIPNGMTMDYDGDGFLDVSFMFLFQPLDPNASGGQLRMTDGNCPVATPMKCMAKPKAGLDVQGAIENKKTGTCLQAVAGSTGGYTPPVGEPAGPCFSTTTGADFVMTVGGIAVAVTSGRISGSYDSSGGVMTGLIEGFVTKAEAMKALLPAYLGPPLAGTPLDMYLKAQDTDMAQSPNGQNGYWLYLNFVAKSATFTP
jgi:hypothetical protein